MALFALDNSMMVWLCGLKVASNFGQLYYLAPNHSLMNQLKDPKIKAVFTPHPPKTESNNTRSKHICWTPVHPLHVLTPNTFPYYNSFATKYYSFSAGNVSRQGLPGFVVCC
jgi:hypothetical protein